MNLCNINSLIKLVIQKFPSHIRTLNFLLFFIFMISIHCKPNSNEINSQSTDQQKERNVEIWGTEEEAKLFEDEGWTVLSDIYVSADSSSSRSNLLNLGYYVNTEQTFIEIVGDEKTGIGINFYGDKKKQFLNCLETYLKESKNPESISNKKSKQICIIDTDLDSWVIGRNGYCSGNAHLQLNFTTEQTKKNSLELVFDDLIVNGDVCKEKRIAGGFITFKDASVQDLILAFSDSTIQRKIRKEIDTKSKLNSKKN